MSHKLFQPAGMHKIPGQKNVSRKVEGNCSYAALLVYLVFYNWDDMNRILSVLCATLVAVSLSAQDPSHHEKVPVMDGGAGPCSLELTVIGADAKPTYAATVKAHMAYGFGGIRRLDLEAGTNSDGKVKFIGLPARVHQPPLQFHASKDEFEGVTAYDPSTECQAKHEIRLQKSKAQAGP
jgi:hypothetical protein